MDEVTATEAATLTGLSERTIRRKIVSGEIPARHVAKNRYAIRVRDLPLRTMTPPMDARIQALEHRVRLLELRLDQLIQAQRECSAAEVAGSALATASPSEASPLEASPLEASPLAPADAASVAALREALSQIVREMAQLGRGVGDASGEPQGNAGRTPGKVGATDR